MLTSSWAKLREKTGFSLAMLCLGYKRENLHIKTILLISISFFSCKNRDDMEVYTQ